MDSYFKELNKIYKENKTNTETVFELDESRIKGLKINYSAAISDSILTTSETEKMIIEILKSKTSDIILYVKKGYQLIKCTLPDSVQVVIKYIIKFLPDGVMQKLADGIIEFAVPKICQFIEVVKKYGKIVLSMSKEIVKKIYAWCKTQVKKGYEAAKEFIKNNSFFDNSKKFFTKIINYFVKLYNKVKPKERTVVENQCFKVPKDWLKNDIMETWKNIVVKMDEQRITEKVAEQISKQLGK